MKSYSCYYRFLLFVLVFTSPVVSCAEPVAVPVVTEVKVKTCVQKIADINMCTFEDESDSWSSYSYVEWMRGCRPRRLNPKMREKRLNAYELFKAIEKKQDNNSYVPLSDENTWLDLELFGGKKIGAPFYGKTIDRTTTEYGKIKLFSLLAQPIKDASHLKHRQEISKTLFDNHDLLVELDKQLLALKKSENVFLSFWQQEDSLKRNMERSLSQFGSLNKSPALLHGCMISNQSGNILGLSTTVFVIATLATYGILSAVNNNTYEWLKNKKKEYQGAGGFAYSWIWKKLEDKFPDNRGVQASMALLSALACGLSIKWQIDNLHGQYLFDDLIHTIMHQVAQSLHALESMYTLIQQNQLLADAPEFAELKKLFTSDNDDIQEFLELMRSDTLTHESTFLSHKGKVIRAFMLMHEIKNDLVLAIDAAASLDVYRSCAALCTEFVDKRVKWCFADYVLADKPSIKAVGFWHPMVNDTAVVSNSISLGVDDAPANMIITGPNAGGKSTILKSLALCILMSQTLGIVPAEQFSLTPFSGIATYLNITDDIGSGNSLYKAEVLRVVELMKKIDGLKEGEFSFALFDEIFNGTSPREGSAAAYSVADHLAQQEKSINLIATHFELITKLADRNKRVANYKVSVSVQDGGQIVYPFTLEPGISHQHVAIDILRNEGVSSYILEQAQGILTRGLA